MPQIAGISDSGRVGPDLISSPVTCKITTAIGIVRFTHLDYKQFEFRGIQAGRSAARHYVYGPKVAHQFASKRLNNRVKVRARARRIKICNLKLVNTSEDTRHQIEFQRPDNSAKNIIRLPPVFVPSISLILVLN